MLVQMHPLPIRIFHWVMFLCVMVLLVTGLYLSSPGDALRIPMRQMRQFHAVFGFILILNFFGQLYYYAVSKRFTEILFMPRDFGNIRSFLRYMFFITAALPNYGRYNPGQKLIFTLWGIAVFLAALGGTILLFTNETEFLQRYMGGLNSIRIMHFMIAVYFAMSIPLHLYLVFAENPAKLQAMFTGYIKKEPELPEDVTCIENKD